MTPERERKIERICQAALDRAGSARVAYLAEACEGDETLRREVEMLLAHEATAARFLSTPAVEVVAKRISLRGDLDDSAAGLEAGSGEKSRLLVPGTGFGPYRILYLLGRGGMGIVYEAEEVASARRVALKVLGTPLEDGSERVRFLREGRLAASINHPSCVYVFGAYEIDGQPAIAMELMRETLADRLRREGPLPPSLAVDAILQVVHGLAAAAEVGILHRDVKPSNCFVGDHDLVKIGDFGISRSTRPAIDTTELSRARHVVGTPTYASPEQLRGASLDPRSDIYSVGATLFELLTGRLPFAATDLVSVLMAVSNDPPPEPYLLNRSIPRGLSAVVVRCLAKKPEQRFANYEQLVAALGPYASATPAAATLGRRFWAGVIDLAIVSMPITALNVGLPLFESGEEFALKIGLRFAECVAIWLYFSLFESVRGATPGKAICGLVVIDGDGPRAVPSRVLTRAAVYVMWLTLMWFVSTREPQSLERILGGPLALLTLEAVALLPLAILFSTARRQNGFAGLHDLVTRTRIVERQVTDYRDGLAMWVGSPPHEVVGHAGPYDVLPDPVRGLGHGWRWGFDPRLRRAVWIRFSDPGAPPIPVARQAVSRGTRLRWLAGRRLGDEAWDAFEAVEGVPLPQATQDGREWAKVRWWLLDLAKECAATADGDRAPRRLERVWVLKSGGVKWIDDPVGDALAAADAVATDQQWLLTVARAALGGRLEPSAARPASRHPLPLGAHRFLERLDRARPEDINGIVRDLEALTTQRAVLTPAWRIVPTAICGLAPVFPLILLFVISTTVDIRQSRVPSDDRAAGALLQLLAVAERGWLPVADRESIERALVTGYREVLADGRLFTPRNMRNLGLEEYHRVLANDVLRRRQEVGPDRQDQANPRVAAMIRRATRQELLPTRHRRLLSDAFDVYLLVALLGAVVNVVFRRGLIRIMGLEVVTADGRPASRLRVLARTAIAWSPVLVVPFTMPFVARLPPGLTGIPWWMLGMLAGAITLAITPARGVQDRLAGTWIVPR